MRIQTSFAACLLVMQVFGCAAIAKDEAPKADNTKQNYGALEKDSVTAEKQKNSKSEISVLAGIRKTIMAEKGLSTDAQNVKIVCSKSGVVTLRGAVDSDNEKEKVGALVKGCNGVSEVKNQLTVAEKPH
ncbi:MAG: BON domain-containing protein [Candidatus Obscuribacterales bacterium]|nr:BON domain-containing protein [Candidatus Obscuribacterales bacterium]